ncbi:hypothetical protein M758_UG016600, partial [Ceratodon purpureus]
PKINATPAPTGSLDLTPAPRTPPESQRRSRAEAHATSAHQGSSAANGLASASHSSVEPALLWSRRLGGAAQPELGGGDRMQGRIAGTRGREQGGARSVRHSWASTSHSLPALLLLLLLRLLLLLLLHLLLLRSACLFSCM